MLPAILQQLGQANPELVQLINDNREDFQALLNTPVAGQGGQPRGNQIQVTPAEHAAIERLSAMGFDRNLVIQVCPVWQLAHTGVRVSAWLSALISLVHPGILCM